MDADSEENRCAPALVSFAVTNGANKIKCINNFLTTELKNGTKH
jgi:hypothetical protein